MLKEFIESVEGAENLRALQVILPLPIAVEVKDFVKNILEARTKGGRIGGKLSSGGGRPKLYKTPSDRQRAYRERKKNKLT